MKKTRAKKGEISISTRNSMLVLRWTYERRRYQLSLGIPNSPANKQAARAKAAEIELDIALQRFDSTLLKYKAVQAVEPAPQPTTLDLWQKFTEHRRQAGQTSGQSIASRYIPLAANLKRFGKDIEGEASAIAFINLLRDRQSPRIANQNLSLMRGFGDWAVSKGHWESNPFAAITPIKAPKPRPVKAFDRKEIRLLLDAAQQDEILSKYRDFILLLLHLGLRPSEAIGLRWGHVDLERKEIHIIESLSRGPDGRSSGGARQQKELKTVNGDRILLLQPTVCSMLAGRLKGNTMPDKNSLIFLSPTGKPIDDHNFSQRTWKRLCEKAGVDHRRPYNTRHTVASHLIQEGANLAQVADVLGHTNIRMVSETYGHMLDRPQMPEF